MKKLLLVFILTLLMAATTASAALITDTQTFSFSGSTSPFNFSLSAFNLAIGTLTDITLTTTTHITAQVQLINFTNQPQNFTDAQSTAPFTLTGPGTLVNASASTGLINGSAAPPMFTITTFSGPTVDQTQTIHLDSSIWDQYTGIDPLSFIATLGPFTSSASFIPGTLGVGGNGLVNGDVTLAYSYEAVPIPGAIWLLGSALIGIVGFRRKFRKV